MAEDWSDLGKVSKEAKESWADLGRVVADDKRTAGERFAQNAEDAAMRNPTVASARETFSNPLAALPISPLLRPGSIASPPSLLDAFTGAKQGLAIAGLAARQLGIQPPAPLDPQRERQRREDFEARSQADPFYRSGPSLTDKAKAGVSTLAGQLAGGLTDPQNLVAPGKGVIGRILGAAGVNAAGDVQTQASDVRSDVQDHYNPLQTVAAAALGSVVQGGFEGAVPIARRAAEAAKPYLDDASRRASGALRATGEKLDRIGDRPIASRSHDTDWTDLGAARDRPAQQTYSEAHARQLAADLGATVTSGYRTPEHNAEVGGVKGSYHTRGGKGDAQAVDLVPRKGMSMAELANEVRRAMPGARIINEGDHVHIQWGRDGRSSSPRRPETLVDDLERGLIADDAAHRGIQTIDGPARPADRQDADGGGAERPGGGNEAASRPETGDEFGFGHIDDNHARLYELGKKAEVGEVDSALADDLARRMTPLMDWTDEPGLSSRERRTIRRGNPVSGRRMIEVAKDYARRFDEHGPEARTSFYDPDRYNEAMAASRRGPTLASDNPIPERPTPRPPAEPEVRVPDITDRAIDLIRRGRDVREDRGQTLMQWLEHKGLRNEGGEIGAMDADIWHRAKPFRRKIVRPTGRTLEDAAVAAQEAGFLPERVGDGDNRATPQDLLDAMREELSGRPRYAREDVDGAELRRHADDIQEVMHAAGIDPHSMSNDEIRAAMDDYFRADTRAALASQRLPSSKGGNAVLPNQRTPQPIASGQGSAYSGRNIASLIEEVRKSLDITHRRGRLRGRRSLGEYDRQSGVVRTKYADDLDVLVHEAGHALEFTHKPKALLAAIRKHAKLLKFFDYEPAKSRRHEGFAEWLRWYVTNPDVAHQKAPGFYDDFEKALSTERPDTLTALQNVQRDWDNYLKADSMAVAKADLAFTGNKGPIDAAQQAVRDDGLPTVLGKVADRAYTWFVDDLYPLQKATSELQAIHLRNKGRALEIKAAESPYVQARLGREGFNAGRVDALHGVVPYRGIDPEGPSLGDAITQVFGKKWTEDALDGFDVYLASRRMIHEWDRFSKGELTTAPDKFSRAVHEQRIADFEAEHPQARDGASLVYEWVSNLWRKEFEAGFISQETYDAGLAKPDYVPLMRDVSDKKPGGSADRMNGDLKNVGGAKRFKGSRRAVISPMTSMMKRAYELNMNIRRVEVVRALDRLAEKAGPGSGVILERLPRTEIEAYQTDALAALEKKLKETGALSKFDITTLMAAAEAGVQGDGTVAMFRRRATKGRPDETVVFDWQDGKPVPLLLPDGEFGREVFAAISGMDREMRSMMIDFASGFTQALRTGVTLSPEFVGANIVRDQLATWINTDVGYVPGISYMRGAIDQVADGQMAKRYQAIGGLKGGLNTAALTRPLPRTDKAARAQRMDLNKANYRARTFRLNQNPLHLAAALTDISETGSRLGVFRHAFAKAKKAGLTDYEAAVEAGITSRDYLDYGRHGSKMLGAVRLVTFLNSAIQGLDKAGRVLNASGYGRPSMAGLRRVLAPIGKAAPRTVAEKAALAHAYKAVVRISMITAFGAGLAALYFDDPEFQEFDDRERATNWFFRAGGHWWKIPKPFELATGSNIAERMIEARLGDDPTAYDRMFSDLAFTIAPPHGLPILSVPIEIMRNRDSFGRPIVPDYKAKSVDPELQYAAYTSKISRTMGRVLHVSPAILDHFVTGFTGTLGRYALQGADLAIEAGTDKPRKAVGPEDAFLTRRFSALPSRSSKSQARFWELASADGGEFTRAEGTFRQLMREARDSEATAYLNRLKPEARAYVVAKVFSESGSSKLHPMVRAGDAVKVLNDIRGELRDGTLTPLNSSRPIRLTPDQMKRADDALTAMSMIEARNALIGIGERGWSQKDLIPRTDPRAALQDVGLLPIVQGRMTLAKVLPAGATARTWARQRRGLEAKVSENDLSRMMAAKRLDSSDMESKRREVVRQLGR